MKMLSSFGPVWNVPANCTDIESQQDVHFWRIFHHVHRSMVDFKEKKGTEKVVEGRDFSATKEMDYLENHKQKERKKKHLVSCVSAADIMNSEGGLKMVDPKP